MEYLETVLTEVAVQRQARAQALAEERALRSRRHQGELSQRLLGMMATEWDDDGVGNEVAKREEYLGVAADSGHGEIASPSKYVMCNDYNGQRVQGSDHSCNIGMRYDHRRRPASATPTAALRRRQRSSSSTSGGGGGKLALERPGLAADRRGRGQRKGPGPAAASSSSC